MYSIIEQIEKIRKLNKQNRLVIFVGAGVSRNSGICSWWQLVRDIAIKIGYDDICEKCEMKYNFYSECGDSYEFCSSNSNCYWKHNFSTDDFLKIPQYFFDTYDKSDYYDLLREKFCKEYVPNAIDELIIELNPEHIITTNYDHLLEDVKHPNVSNYTIIKNDKDILEKYGKHYIIKMHGDIENIENIVLKEDDYLKYSHTHEIIESYIKSLLFDKTFLFIGYSLNDNNLKLIMSYIDNYVKNNKINNRTPHYLIVNNPQNKEREHKYWSNKGVQLVDLCQINHTMRKQTQCEVLKNEQGKLLYSFLKYLQNEKLPYYDDEVKVLKERILKEIPSLDSFNFITCATLLKICNFSNRIKIINSSIDFRDENEYQILKAIFESNDNYSNHIKQSFAKSEIYSIQCYDEHHKLLHFKIPEKFFASDELYELSLNNQYSKIVNKLETYPDDMEKAYYYYLIYGTDYNKCQEIMNNIKIKLDALDYKKLSNKDIQDIIIYKCNSIYLKILKLCCNPDELNELKELLNNNLDKNKEYNYILQLFNGNGELLNKLNNYLLKHQEYYMEKSTKTKWGGTIYGNLFELQCIVYDYYKFYKKNHMMLDWFRDVSNICEPYIKAMLCTYYPDEYQFSRNDGIGRTQVEPYPLTLIDIDMIVKHTELKKLNSWIDYYKVFSIKLENEIDIAELFYNFCISIRKFKNRYLLEKIEVFSKFISIIELTQEQKNHIVCAFIALVIPDEEFGIEILRESLNAIWIFVQKHYITDNNYKKILELLICEELIKDTFISKKACEKLINKISNYADEKIYNSCFDMIHKNSNNRERCYFTFVYRSILLRYEPDYWRKWIVDNISHNWTPEIYEYLESEIITFNVEVKRHFEKILIEYSTTKTLGVYSYPDNQKEVIESLINLLLSGHISSLDDIDFLKQYSDSSDYLNFLFCPDSFDYSKINIADYMWCNIINNDVYRNIILKNKLDFWTKDDEKRIKLGFGGNFENYIAYKYLFD